LGELEKKKGNDGTFRHHSLPNNMDMAISRRFEEAERGGRQRFCPTKTLGGFTAK